MARTPLAMAGSVVCLAVVKLFADQDFGVVGFFLALAWLIYIREQLAQYRRRRVLRSAELVDRTDYAEPVQVAAYLDALDAALAMPADVRIQIRTELADHLADSIAALQAEGLASEQAIRESLARLGRSDELARHLRAAHQSPQALLAGAAGGVWSAGTAAVKGYLIAGLSAYFLSIAGSIALGRLLAYAGSNIHLGIDGGDLATGTAIACVLAWVPAYLAGKEAVIVSSDLSNRPIEQLAPWWALAGAVAIGCLLMFVTAVQQSWLATALEMTIPLAFAGGALVAPGRPTPKVRASVVLLAVAAIIVLGFVTNSIVPGAVEGGSFSWNETAAGFDRVAPAAPGQPVMRLAFDHPTYGNPVFEERWSAVPGANLSRYSAIHFEIWRVKADPNAPEWESDYLGPVDPAYSAPYAVVAPTHDGDTFDVAFDLRHSRDQRWLVFAVGLGPDGKRVRLGEPIAVRTSFSGTIWDWLTAAG